MNAKTLKALKGSIVKWKKIVTGKGEDDGRDNCPLCSKFNDFLNSCNSMDGERCPVKIRRGRNFCRNTPYAKWNLHQHKVHSSYAPFRVVKDCPKCKRLAQAELDFLRSLLPEEKQ